MNEFEFNEWTGKSDIKPVAYEENIAFHISSDLSSIFRGKKIKQEFHSLGETHPIFLFHSNFH